MVEAGGEGEGVLGAFLACDPVPGESLMVRDLGMSAGHERVQEPYDLSFDGREVFRNAVPGMASAAELALSRAGLTTDDVALVVPHQANLRIIEAVGKRLGVDVRRFATNLQRYGNTSAASIPLALTEALEEGRVEPGSALLFAAFGAGLTSAACALRWGGRTEPLGASNAALPPCDQDARELLGPALDFQQQWNASH